MAIIRGPVLRVWRYIDFIVGRLSARKVKAKIWYERSSKFSNMREKSVCKEMGLLTMTKCTHFLSVPGPKCHQWQVFVVELQPSNCVFRKWLYKGGAEKMHFPA